MFRVLSEKLRFTVCVPEEDPGTHIFLSLGSNLGDRRFYLEEALQHLCTGGFCLQNISCCYRTDAVGCEEGAEDFLNIVAEGYWKKTPLELLALCKKIETLLGRPVQHAHWVSRVVDIDIILFGEEEIRLPDLCVPHPLAAERLFVMGPLAEIAPDLVFPGTGKSCRLIRQELAAAL